MKIGIDARTLCVDKPTGVEIYAKELIKAILKIDDNGKYRLFTSGVNKKYPDDLLKLFPAVKLFSLSISNRLLNLGYIFFKFPKIDKIMNGVDIFFSPRYLFSAFSKGVKSVITFHDASFVHFPNFFSFRQRIWHSALNDKMACINSKALIANSNSTKRDLVSFFKLNGDKIHVAYPGIDHSKYYAASVAKETDLIKEKFGIPGKYFLFLGTIEPRKNVLGIIRAFEKTNESLNKNFDLIICGNLGWLYKETLSYARKSKVRSKIKFLEYVEESLKPILYRNAQALVFPSYYEGFGFPPLEAAACGCPSIISNNTSFPEALGDGALYINPFDSLQITKSFELLVNEKYRKDLSDKALRQAIGFTWESTARKIIDVLNAVHERI